MPEPQALISKYKAADFGASSRIAGINYCERFISLGMSNVLSEEKKQQVIALGKLGWPLRRIEQATGVRRETASAYLKAAGIVVRLPRFWGRRIPAKPANELTPIEAGGVQSDRECAAVGVDGVSG